MGSKKFKGQKNISGTLIKKHREDMGLTKVEFCKRLEFEGVNISRNKLLRIEKNQLLVKDFEIAAISKVLNIDLYNLKDYLED